MRQPNEVARFHAAIIVAFAVAVIALCYLLPIVGR